MARTETVVIAALLGAAAGAAVALVAKSGSASSASSSPATPQVAGGGKVSWAPATVLQPGDKVRVAVAPSDFTQLATSLGISGAGMAGWQNLLANPTVQHVLMAPTLSAWAPGDALPLDWPAADTSAATEYHAEFTYGGVGPLDITQQPLPLRAWVAKAA